MAGEPGAVTLTLEHSRVWRGISRTMVAFALLGAGMAVVFGLLAESVPDPADLLVPLVQAVTFGGAALLLVVAGWLYFAGHPPDGWMHIDDDGITLDNPAVFRGPIRIPRAAVRSVSVDRDVAPLAAQMPLEWFPIEGGGSETCPDTHLASRRRGRFLLPGINAESVVPNLAVVLDPPLDVPPIRLRAQLSPGLTPLRAPLWRRDLPGFFVRVVEIDEAVRVFASWGVLRPPRAEEVAVAAERAFRHSRVWVAVAIVVLIVVKIVTT